MGRRRAGVGRAAHAGIVGRRGHLTRRAVRARHGARRLVPDRPAPPGRAVRRVADAHRGCRRRHLRPLRRITARGRDDARCAPGPGRRHPPRPGRADRGVDDPRARGLGRHPACRAGRRRPAGRHHPLGRRPHHPPRSRRRSGRRDRPARAVLGGRPRCRGRPVAGLRAARGLHPSRQPLPLERRRAGGARRARARRRARGPVRRGAGALPVGRRHRDRAVPDPPRRRAARRGHALHPDRLRRVRHRRDAGLVPDHRGVGRGRRACSPSPGSGAATRRARRGTRRVAASTSSGSSTTSTPPPTTSSRRGAPRGTGWPSGAAPTAASSSAWP